MKKREYLKYAGILLFSILLSYTIYNVRKSIANSSSIEAETKDPLLATNEVKNLISKPLMLSNTFSFAELKTDNLVNINVKNDLGQNHIFILLNQGDCYDCYKDVAFWNRLQHLSDSLKVFTVINNDNVKYMKDFIKGNDIKVPVLIDKENSLFSVKDSIPNVYTPIVLFVNKNGVLLSATNSNYGNLVGQENLIKYLNHNL